MGTRIPRVPKMPMQGTLLSTSLDSADDILAFPTKETEAAVPAGGRESSSLPEMDFDRMKDFTEHCFRLYTGERLADMVKSVEMYGILQPLILWHNEEGYVLLSGYNRRNAGRLAGLTKAPVIIKENISRSEAILIMTETNLRQRSFSDLAESERAFCLKQHYEAMKCQGRRSDLLTEIEELLCADGKEGKHTLSEHVTRLRSDARLGAEYKLNRDKVAKYIRIAGLIPPLLDRLDQGEIPFLTAYYLSFIEDRNLQECLEQLLKEGRYHLDKKKAGQLHRYAKEKKLTEELVEEILSGIPEVMDDGRKPKPIQVKADIISRYFTPAQSRNEIEETIDKALELYFSRDGITEHGDG